MDDVIWKMLVEGGSAAGLIFLVFALIRGWLRSSQEVDAWKSYGEDMRDRARVTEAALDRANEQLLKITSALEALARDGCRYPKGQVAP